MPRGDGTGPQGQGPMTGGGFGYCSGNATAGFASSARRGTGRAMAWGRGGGGGLGMANRFGQGGGRRGAGRVSGFAQVDEKSLLRGRLASLEQSEAEIRQRLNEIEQSED